MNEKKKTLRTVTPEVVATLKKKLKALPKLEEKKLTKSEAIRELAGEIEELRASKGYTYAAVADAMKASGLNVSGRTLQIALATGAGRGNAGKTGGGGTTVRSGVEAAEV